ncbi:unnamed protein product [Discosporangium mesarthrocarpum]
MAALFAMQQLGMDLVVYNRTPEKADRLAGRFGGAAVSSLDAETLKGACGRGDVDVVVSTIPGSAEFTLPEHLLENKVRGGAGCKRELASCVGGKAGTVS